jgi:hypothetical protein
LVRAYVTAASKLKEGDPRVADEVTALREVISAGQLPDSEWLSALAQAYAAVASKLKEGDPRAADEVAALRDAIGKSTNSDQLSLPGQLSGLAQAYAAMATKLKEVDPHGTEVFAALRAAIGESTYTFELEPLTTAYMAMATKLTEGDPRAANEVAALCDTIANSTDPDQLSALAQVYAAVAAKLKEGDPRATSRSAFTPEQDLALLIGQMPLLRTPEQGEAFAAAIKEATRLGLPSLSWDKVGLIVAAALLQPVSAGKPSHKLVSDYEGLVRTHPNAPKPAKSWSGDVWAFAVWARDNLPGFDPHRPRVGFLPAVAIAGSR